MKEPNLVGDCISEMKNACNLPITVKTRIGYDNFEDYEYLKKFLTIIKKLDQKLLLFMLEEQY